MIFRIFKFVLVLWCITSCESSEIIEIDYCKMIETDQQHVNTDKSNLKKFNEDKAKRHLIFEKNFNQILDYSKKRGFPKISQETYHQDSCKFFGVTMTMIHIAQSKPEVFFNKRMAEFFKSEMEKGNIEKNLLKKSSMITIQTNEFCYEIKDEIEYSLKIWGIGSDILENSRFIDCKK